MVAGKEALMSCAGGNESNPRFAIRNPQFAIRNSQFEIAIRNQKSKI